MKTNVFAIEIHTRDIPVLIWANEIGKDNCCHMRKLIDLRFFVLFCIVKITFFFN